MKIFLAYRQNQKRIQEGVGRTGRTVAKRSVLHPVRWNGECGDSIDVGIQQGASSFGWCQLDDKGPPTRRPAVRP